MSLKISDIISPMVKAAASSLGEDWPEVKDYAVPELRKLAQSLIDITELRARDKLTQRQARSLIRIHKNTTMMVMLTVEGLGIIAVENAINAALKAVRETVNTFIGFKLV